jgi:hypothetical protein
LIDVVLADGVITDKERAVIHKRAQSEGIDPDEIDVFLDGRIESLSKEHIRSSFVETDNHNHSKDNINIEVNNKTSINGSVIGWLISIIVVVLLTFYLNQILYKTAFGIYTFILGLSIGALLHAKLRKHE